MIVRNTDQHTIENAALDAGVSLQKVKRVGRGVQFRLALAPDKRYQRLGFTGRRIAAVCWHGHRAFFEALYQRAPLATVHTAQATYTSAADFDATHDDTGYRNIGSQMDPLSYRAACLCSFG